MIFCENMADALGKKIPCSQFQVQVTPQAGTIGGGGGGDNAPEYPGSREAA